MGNRPTTEVCVQLRPLPSQAGKGHGFSLLVLDGEWGFRVEGRSGDLTMDLQVGITGSIAGIRFEHR